MERCPYKRQISSCTTELSLVCDKTEVAGIQENVDPVMQGFVEWAQEVFGESIFTTPGQLPNICAQFCSMAYNRKMGSRGNFIEGIRSGHPRLGDGR